MAQDPLEIIERHFELWNSGNAAAALADVDPEVTIDWSESRAPYAGVYSGIGGYQRLFDEIRDAFEGTSTEFHDRVVCGPHVAIANTVHMRGRSGVEVGARSTIVWTFADGKIVAVRLFQDHADAMRAIGADP